MSTKPADAPSATNVLTYVSKLDKLSKSSKFSDWYDWLSDASHPAFGARLVYVTFVQTGSRASLSGGDGGI